MNLESGSARISLFRESYSYLHEEEAFDGKGDRTEVMNISWTYDMEEGGGIISEEYIYLEDIRRMNQALKKLEYGTEESLQMDLYGPYEMSPLIRLEIGKTGECYLVTMQVYHAVLDEYITASVQMAAAEWKVFSDEWRDWGRKRSPWLGDQVQVHLYDGVEKVRPEKVGTVIEVIPHEKHPRVAVGCLETDWQGKKWIDARIYEADHVEKLSSPHS